MAGQLDHAFVSVIADDPIAEAAGEVTPTRWNLPHAITTPFTIAEILSDHDKAAHDALGISSTKTITLFADAFNIATDNAAQYPGSHGYTPPTDGHPESFTFDLDDTRTEQGSQPTPLPNVPATALITVHYRGSGDAGNVMFAFGAIGIADNEDSLTPTEPTLVNFSSEDTTTADTNHRSISTTHTFAASVASGKMNRCAIGRVPASETSSMVGDVKILYVTIDYTEV